MERNYKQPYLEVMYSNFSGKDAFYFNFKKSQKLTKQEVQLKAINPTGTIEYKFSLTFCLVYM